MGKLSNTLAVVGVSASLYCVALLINDGIVGSTLDTVRQQYVEKRGQFKSYEEFELARARAAINALERLKLPLLPGFGVERNRRLREQKSKLEEIRAFQD